MSGNGWCGHEWSGFLQNLGFDLRGVCGLQGLVGWTHLGSKGEFFLGFECGKKAEEESKEYRGGWVGGCEN